MDKNVHSLLFEEESFRNSNSFFYKYLIDERY